MGLPEEFRKKAEALFDESEKLMSSRDQITKENMSIIVGFVTAKLYNALADSVEYLRGSIGSDSAMVHRKRVLDHNDKIRKAAASGDWEEFDRLTKEGYPKP